MKYLHFALAIWWLGLAIITIMGWQPDKVSIVCAMLISAIDFAGDFLTDLFIDEEENDQNENS